MTELKEGTRVRVVQYGNITTRVEDWGSPSVGDVGTVTSLRTTAGYFPVLLDGKEHTANGGAFLFLEEELEIVEEVKVRAVPQPGDYVLIEGEVRKVFRFCTFYDPDRDVCVVLENEVYSFGEHVDRDDVRLLIPEDGTPELTPEPVKLVWESDKIYQDSGQYYTKVVDVGPAGTAVAWVETSTTSEDYDEVVLLYPSERGDYTEIKEF